MNKGQAYILSAPAGTGKTTLVEQLLKEFPGVVKSISYTTRAPRSSEKEGKDYHFISLQRFEQKLNKGDFIEYAEVFGHFYGTDKKDVEKLLEQGFDTILVIDTQGALTLKPIFKAVYVFMSPPSLEELERRLRKRKTETQEELKIRLNQAKKEMDQACHYDYHIINCNLKNTYSVLKSILVAEKYKVKKKYIEEKK